MAIKPGYYPCAVAPEGSRLRKVGTGSGGRGHQWFFELPDGRISLGFTDRASAEWWATEGMIKFTHPRQTRKQQESRAC